MNLKSKIKLIAFCLLFGLSLYSCSDKDEPVRSPEDIMGVWKLSDTSYLEFSSNNIVHNLQIQFQDDQSIGIWENEVYFYEPGYNLVIYLTAQHQANIYQITEMSNSSLTWCWVEEIETASTEKIGEIIGNIIKEAQEGFTLNPELYQTFVRISEDEFLDILENINIMEPW